MARLVGLLRGINLGAKRRIAMADLRELMAELGYEDVRTVLASGNVVFSGSKAKAREKIERGLEQRFGFKVDVVLRTMDELHAVVADEPFGDAVDNETRYFVVFLPERPDVSSLDGVDVAPDAFAVGGREIYAWCPDGLQNSRLMKALGKPGIASTATVRNMATVKKLLE
jgi:uncharacterized protein (DUF1697 family)